MSKQKAEKEARKILRDYGLAIGGSILVALFIRFFLLEAYRMPSRAMQPAVEPGDTLFVSKFAYGFRIPGADTRLSEAAPRYGDVAVLEFPEEPGRNYIKRILGLPGDKVKIERGIAFLNGARVTAPLEENSTCGTEKLPDGPTYTVCLEPPLLTMEQEITVPPGQVFVAGDLRSTPLESRRLKVYGLVPYGLLQGRAQFVWLSIQPPGSGGGDWFSRIRFERLFKGIR